MRGEETATVRIDGMLLRRTGARNGKARGITTANAKLRMLEFCVFGGAAGNFSISIAWCRHISPSYHMFFWAGGGGVYAHNDIRRRET